MSTKVVVKSVNGDISNTSPLEGVNLLDTMKYATSHMRHETNIIPSAPPSKHDLLDGPDKGGETEIQRKNAIIFTEHKIVDDNNNNILCQDNRGSSNNIHLPIGLTISISYFLEIILGPSVGTNVTCKKFFRMYYIGYLMYHHTYNIMSVICWY